MKRQADQREVIILGSGLGGMIAGAYLAKENHDVLILKERSHRPHCVKGGYRFFPFPNFSEKLLRRDLLEKISQTLNVSLTTDDRKKDGQSKAKLKRPKEEVSFQVILPKARIDLFSQRALFQRECKREFPDDLAQIEKFYDEMDRIQSRLNKRGTEQGPSPLFPLQPRSGFRKWFSLDRLPKERMDKRLSLFSKEFREFVQLQLISWADLCSVQLPISLASYLLANKEGDVRTPSVDLETVRESIFQEFLRSNGGIEEIDDVKMIEMGWRGGVTLSFPGGQRPFRSKCLILNAPLHRLSYLIRKKERLLSKWQEKIQPRYVRFPVFLGIREKVVPVGMRDLLVSIQDLNRGCENGNVLFLSLSQKGDETRAPEERRALTVESLVPVDKMDLDSLARHQERVMKHLNYLFPFMEKYVDFIEWNWAHEQFLRWSYPYYLYETTSHFDWREGLLPPRISRHLYFTGKENFPYLGLEGEVLSGLIVAQEIVKRYS